MRCNRVRCRCSVQNSLIKRLGRRARGISRASSEDSEGTTALHGASDLALLIDEHYLRISGGNFCGSAARRPRADHCYPNIFLMWIEMVMPNSSQCIPYLLIRK